MQIIDAILHNLGKHVSRTRLALRGSASNIVRLVVSVLAAALVPPFLVRHLSQPEYSAWVLILQLSAYISLLDLGLQTAIAKFVAEYHAIGDHEANHDLVSTSLSTFIGTALVGAAAVCFMTYRVPELFHQMPPALYPGVRWSLLAVGLSAAFSLPFSPFLSVFTGLQDYAFPTIITAVSRILSAAGLMILLLLHGGLVELALAIAVTNIATAIAQYHGWKRYARERVAFSFPFFNRKSAVKLTKYSGVLVIWTLGGLCVSGLDLVIVGHFDYLNTGFYAIGASATNFMLVVVSSLFGPLIPAISSLQADRTPRELGELAIRATRYGTLLLFLLGLPLLIFAYPLLSLWVGHEYALRSVLFLQILVLGNMVRHLSYPYSLVVVAVGKQHYATIAAISEAIVNVALSIWLAHRIGALGVAIGTFAGSFVSLGLHFAVSMRYTRSSLSFERTRLVLHGLLRPLASAIPTLFLYPFWERTRMMPASLPLLFLWLIFTAALMWLAGLTSAERGHILDLVLRRSKPEAQVV